MESVMKKLLILFCIPLIGSSATPVFANQKGWEALNTQVIELYRQRKYDEAAEKAEESLKVARETFGRASQQAAQSLNNLALVFEAQKKYADAEARYKEALPILEKSVGPDHPHVATLLENEIEVLKKEGKSKEAAAMEIRLNKIREKNK